MNKTIYDLDDKILINRLVFRVAYKNMRVSQHKSKGVNYVARLYNKIKGGKTGV